MDGARGVRRAGDVRLNPLVQHRLCRESGWNDEIHEMEWGFRGPTARWNGFEEKTPDGPVGHCLNAFTAALTASTSRWGMMTRIVWVCLSTSTVAVPETVLRYLTSFASV